MVANNNATLIRRDLLTRMIELQLDNKIGEMDRIPLKMRPRNGDHIRCCIYKDRALLKYKIMGLLGFDLSDESDELTPIKDYFFEMLETETYGKKLLSVIEEVCSSCDSGNYVVTNMCRGCVSRSCMMSCNKEAINIVKGQAVIDKNKCVNCGLCQKACPYHAIIYTPVPCEEACPVKAINKNNSGKEHIDEKNCIYCGKCIESCPFGAIIERSHIFRVIRDIQKSEKLVALIAPALGGQFKSGLQNIINVIKQLGFGAVIEVAEGANITTDKEAAELKHKIESGEKLMTTSCCPSYVNLVNRHIPELKPFVSATKSPMYYAAEIAKNEYPDAKIVFFSPCLGKKHEASHTNLVDYVISFEELGTWMVAQGLEISTIDTNTERNIAHSDSRGYAIAGGVTNAVLNKLTQNLEIHPSNIQGIDKQQVKNLKMVPKIKQDFNFLEVMSCENGCIGGCNTIAKANIAKRQIENELIKTKEQHAVI